MESSNEQQLIEIFEQHRGRLLEMLRRRIDPALRSRLDADDILSEAFIKARRRWGEFADSGMQPYPWLFRIAYDQLIEVWRSHSRAMRDPARQLPFPDHSSIQLGLRIVAPGTTPSGAAVRQEDAARLRNLMGQLPDGDKDILWMRYFEELSYKDVAAVLDITANAAAQRCARALQRLKRLWNCVTP